MFFSFIFIAFSLFLGGADTDTAYATNTVEIPVQATSVVEISDGTISAYVG